MVSKLKYLEVAVWRLSWHKPMGSETKIANDFWHLQCPIAAHARVALAPGPVAKTQKSLRSPAHSHSNGILSLG